MIRPAPRTDAHAAATFGERVADGAACAIGSWRFILIQTAAVIVWVAGNLYEALHFDPFPFILLNLMFSVQAAYTGPILLLAANRQSKKDREIAARDDEEIGLLVGLQQDQMVYHRWQRESLEALLKRMPIALAELDLAALQALVEREKRRIAAVRELAGNEHYDHPAPQGAPWIGD